MGVVNAMPEMFSRNEIKSLMSCAGIPVNGTMQNLWAFKELKHKYRQGRLATRHLTTSSRIEIQTYIADISKVTSYP